MKILKVVSIFLTMTFLVIGCGSSSNDSGSNEDNGLSGTWDGMYNYQSCSMSLCNTYNSPVTYTMIDSNGSVTGTYSTSNGGAGTIAGNVNGGNLIFTVAVTFPCVTTLNGNGTVSGNSITYNLSGPACGRTWNGSGTMSRS